MLFRSEEFQKKLTVHIADVSSSQSLIEVEPRKADELINELFPRNLSHYFLFDGERWSDISVNGVKENIRDSVHILTGLSAYQAAMKHLKDMGSYSVISKFKKKISGSGNLYDNLESDCQQCGRKIEHCKREIENLEINLPGLPPGPIGSPGMSAIKAVLAPEKTEYLYFVAEKDGHHRFSKTYNEHLRAICVSSMVCSAT